MIKNELFSQFALESEQIKSQISEISASLDEEKLPDASKVQNVLSGIDHLRSLHQQIREYAGSILSADELPAENMRRSQIFALPSNNPWLSGSSRGSIKSKRFSRSSCLSIRKTPIIPMN